MTCAAVAVVGSGGLWSGIEVPLERSEEEVKLIEEEGSVKFVMENGSLIEAKEIAKFHINMDFA